jgi:hypothetical protein
MKPFCLTTLIVVLLLVCANGIQAQAIQTKLNQIELMKQFIGSWKSEVAKDTILFSDANSYGNGLEMNWKYVTKGMVVWEGKKLWGYDNTVDKLIVPSMDKDGWVVVSVYWFISRTKYMQVHYTDIQQIQINYSDISNPEKASWRSEGEFITPDMIVETEFVNNQPVHTDTHTRVK